MDPNRTGRRLARQHQLRRRRFTAALIGGVIVAGAVAGVLTAFGGTGRTHEARQKPPAGHVERMPAAHTKGPSKEAAAVKRFVKLGRPLWCGGHKGRYVALTFDDGPGPYTTRYAFKIFKQFNVRVTWFLVGRLLSSYPGVARRELAFGPLGDHTWTHAYLPGLSFGQIAQEIASAQNAIEKASRRPVTLFRPPYGARDARIDAEAKSLGMLQVLWSIDSLDSQGADWNGITREVLKQRPYRVDHPLPREPRPDDPRAEVQHPPRAAQARVQDRDDPADAGAEPAEPQAAQGRACRLLTDLSERDNPTGTIGCGPMRLLVARCEVRYTGRLTALLPEAVRLLILKADGSVLVHDDAGGFKPLNWMTGPTHIEELGDVLFVRKPKTEDMLEIRLAEILSDVAHDMGESAALQKDGVERDLQLELAAEPTALGEELRLVQREWMTDVGPVDLMCRDEDGGWVAVEIKRMGTIDAVEQLTRYLGFIRADPAKSACRGILAAQRMKPQAIALAESRGIRCVEVDLAVLRGEREPDLTLFQLPRS